MTLATSKPTFRERERLIIRKRRLFSPHKWIAMGDDADGAWIEVFYSSRQRREAVRCVEALTEERYKCTVAYLERY